MTDQYTDPWDAPAERDPLLTEWDDEWAAYQEWRATEIADRMERFQDPHGNSFVACVVCHERHGKIGYDLKCQQCWEAGRGS